MTGREPGRGRSDPRRFGDLAGPDASCARLHELRRAFDQRANALQIRQPTPFREIVCVGNIVARDWALAADFTSLRHGVLLVRPKTGGRINYHMRR